MSPVTRVKTSTVLELVGKDEEVNTSDWGEDIAFTLRPEDVSGEVLGINLVGRLFSATGGTTGANIPVPAGKLFFFDADPGLSVGDTELTSGIHDNIIGEVVVAASDWYLDAKGSAAYFDNPIAFYSLKTLYMAWFHTDATDINDATDDDEVLEMVFRYRTEDKD